MSRAERVTIHRAGGESGPPRRRLHREVSGSSRSGQPIPLSQNTEMMCGVPQNDVHHGPSARSKTVRNPDARPRGRRDAVHECQRARSLQLELRHEATDAAQVELAFRCIHRLVKSGQFGRVTAADPEQPVGEHSFRIQKVADDFLDRPFSFRIAEHRARFSEARTEFLELGYLCPEMSPDLTVGKRSKEVLVERSSFLRRHR